MTANFSQIVFVTVTDFFDQTMGSQTLNDDWDLSGCFMRQFDSQVFILKTADIKFSTGNGLKDFLIIVRKQVKALIGSIFLDDGFFNLFR